MDTHLWGKIVPYNLHNHIGNIYGGAWLLRMYLDQSNGNYFEALAKYKGYCSEGKRRAKKVLEIRRQ